MEPMYRGIPFSPQTVLTDSIGAADTVIPVDDVSAFPDAPNYATIGTDTDGETILYAAKATGALSGCTRGVEGIAKAWGRGSIIARNHTAKDMEALQKNVEDHDTALLTKYSAENTPPYPVTKVNGKTGAVSLSAADVGAVPTASIVQTTGDSESVVMSQKAVTEGLAKAKQNPLYLVLGDTTNNGESFPVLGAYEGELGSPDSVVYEGADAAISAIDAAHKAGKAMFAIFVGDSDVAEELPYEFPFICVIDGMYEFGFFFGNEQILFIIEDGEAFLENYLFMIEDDLPTKLPNPEALTINGTEYDGSEAVNLTIDGGTGDNIPDYVRTEAERVAKVVQSRQNANTITFLACSDIHYYSPDNATSNVNADKMHEAVVSMGQAMGLIRERCHIDFGVMFGDMTWDYGETHDEALAEMRFVNSCLSEGFGPIPQLRMEGNHDDGYESGSDLTAGEIFANIGAWNSGAVYGDRAAGYCYRDFEDVKLRVIALNSSQYGGSAAQYNPEQVTWLAKALNLSEKGAGWRSVILGHHPLDWGRNGGTDPTATINAASGLIASFHGHIHNFLVGTVSNTDLPRIAIPNAGYSRENQYGTSYGVNWKESTTYGKTPGTATNTSFCVVTIDTAAKKIFADHYGAGYDRVIPYDDVVLATYTVTNNLTNVTNSSSATEVEEGWSYSATLTAFSGHAISSVVVKMGGVDITSTAYSGGKITISSVTGDIVITAVAVESDTPDQPPANYTNLVPTSIDPATQAIYGVDYNGDGTPDGYKNDVYGSGAGEGSSADANCVLTGLITYGNDISTPIYVKGADITTASHCRILGFDNKYDCYFQAASGSAITTYFTVETLDASAKYYKVTPIRSAITGQTDYLRFSLINPDGGANLIITVGEPIE